MIPSGPLSKLKVKLAERDVAAQLVTLMQRLGWRPFRQTSAAFQNPRKQWVQVGEKGMPDYRFEYYICPGFCLTLYVETKSQRRGTIDPDQQKWHYGMQARGALIYVMRDIEEFFPWYEERFGWLRTDGITRVEKALKAIAGLD